MADFVFNIAKGKVGEYAERINANDPANSALVFVLLQGTPEADDTLKDYDDLAALLVPAANVEADFTNYGARKTLTDTDNIVVTVTDGGDNKLEVDCDDLTWTSAGNGTNNNLSDLLVCYDSDTTGGTDTNIVPLSCHDFVVTTDGSDVLAQFNAAGFFRAA